jgi:TonB family protein
MSENWKQWEGRTVDGRFPLQSYLGGSDHSAVFLTDRQSSAGDSGKAAIKLISAEVANVEQQLGRWKSARELTHPNLIRIYEAGRCELDGTQLLYVVEEYAEENLSQILPERALTAEEARGMLPPVLRALQFLHDKGFVHGHIQPSNILAIADQVKLSTDALSVPGKKRVDARSASPYASPESATGEISSAADVWQLGMTLVEVLTQRLPVWDRTRSSEPELPAAVPQPFREIAWQCLQVDAGKRWSVAEINDRLEGKPPRTKPAQPAVAVASPAILGQEKPSAKWPYWLVFAAVVAIVFFLIGRPKRTSPTVAVQDRPATRVENDEIVPTSPHPQPQTSKSAASKTSNLSASANPEEGRVAERVIPQVSPGALRSIRGKIRIQVRVDVDENGNVTQARLKTSGPSKYFARQALEAARKWTFTAPRQNGHPVASRWVVQFALTRRAIDDSVVRIEP